MEETCRDFWKMVHERECGVIVMLSAPVEEGHVSSSSWWPQFHQNQILGSTDQSLAFIQVLFCMVTVLTHHSSSQGWAPRDPSIVLVWCIGSEFSFFTTNLASVL